MDHRHRERIRALHVGSDDSARYRSEYPLAGPEQQERERTYPNEATEGDPGPQRRGVSLESPGTQKRSRYRRCRQNDSGSRTEVVQSKLLVSEPTDGFVIGELVRIPRVQVHEPTLAREPDKSLF
jgi:hypothetical protein